MTDSSLLLLAQDAAGGGLMELVQGFITGIPQFLSFAMKHWQFCLLHFLEFAIWGAWFVVLGNFLNARGFSRSEIGRIYSTIPIGSIISPLFIGAVADKYVNTEILIGISHLVGAALLFWMARTSKPRQFYWITLLYALVFAPTLSLVNSIVFAHDQDIFGGELEFPWIRVFGTLGWIAAGLSHPLILKKGEPVSERPLLLACVLSVLLGVFAFSLPETKPAAQAEDTALPQMRLPQMRRSKTRMKLKRGRPMTPPRRKKKSVSSQERSRCLPKPQFSLACRLSPRWPWASILHSRPCTSSKVAYNRTWWGL